MPLGAEDVQATDFDHFVVVGISINSVAREDLVPLRGRHLEFSALVIEQGCVSVGRTWRMFGQSLRKPSLYRFLLGHELRIAAQQNVCTAAGHIRSDCDPALAPGLSNDFRFALMKLGIQDDVILEPFFLQ